MLDPHFSKVKDRRGFNRLLLFLEASPSLIGRRLLNDENRKMVDPDKPLSEMRTSTPMTLCLLHSG